MADGVVRGTKDFQVPKYFNFADVIDDWARKEKKGRRQSNTPALWWVDGQGNEVKWSFQDVSANSKKTASVLSTVASVKPGERVMMILPVIPEYWLIQAACLRTGAVCVDTPAIIGPKELERRILQAKPVCMVVAVCDQIKKELLDVVDQLVSSGQADLRSRILITRMQEERREGWLYFDKLFEMASSDYLSVKTLSSSPCLISFTSGTTGNAKMIEHSHASMGIGGTGMRIERYQETDLSWSSCNTGWSWLFFESLFCAWSVGSSTFAHFKNPLYSTARETLEILQAYPITEVTLNNSKYVQMLDEDDLESFKFPKLKRCFLGGESISEQVMRDWEERTGSELYNYYGQSEANILTFKRDMDESHIGSVGTPFAGVDMLIIDDNMQEVPHGSLGRVVLRVKPYCYVGLFTCYADDPDKTTACYSGDFYLTGDLGRRDASGHFWILGRVDNIIFHYTCNVNPVEVEDCLKKHPAVRDCAVVGAPGNMGQGRIKAFIELSKAFKNKGNDELATELQDHVAQNTGKWMTPDKVEFVEEMPKNLTGKIDRRELERRENR